MLLFKHLTELLDETFNMSCLEYLDHFEFFLYIDASDINLQWYLGPVAVILVIEAEILVEVKEAQNFSESR